MNISDLKQAPALREQNMPAVSPGFFSLQSFELMQRIAKVFTSSPLVPKQYQGVEGLPSAIIALNMAHRMGADPLMVMQNLYIVHERPAWSAQFLIACFNQCGRFSAIRYRWQGEVGKDSWGCRAFAKELSSGEEIVGPLVTIELAKAEGWAGRSGSKWKTIPELMLTYRAASWFVRTHAPEIAMGLPTAEEVGDVIDVTPHYAPSAAEVVRPFDKQAETVQVDKSTGELTGMEPPTYPEVAHAINVAKDWEELGAAESLIASAIKDAKQQEELRALATQRKDVLADIPQ